MPFISLSYFLCFSKPTRKAVIDRACSLAMQGLLQDKLVPIFCGRLCASAGIHTDDCNVMPSHQQDRRCFLHVGTDCCIQAKW